MIRKKDTCMRCGRKLDHSKSKWLEINCGNGLFCDPDVTAWPEEESQGCFEFGQDCAKAILANNGKMELVGRAARINR